jgi:hypothetical protein
MARFGRESAEHNGRRRIFCSKTSADASLKKAFAQDQAVSSVTLIQMSNFQFIQKKEGQHPE